MLEILAHILCEWMMKGQQIGQTSQKGGEVRKGSKSLLSRIFMVKKIVQLAKKVNIVLNLCHHIVLVAILV